MNDSHLSRVVMNGALARLKFETEPCKEAFDLSLYLPRTMLNELEEAFHKHRLAFTLKGRMI